MKLLTYLEEHFPATEQWADQELTDRFMQQFGVGAHVERDEHGSYWQFKYNIIEANWSVITRECRGAILHQGEQWQILSRPFDKFFNQPEGHSGLSDEKKFNARIKDMRFVEKADGTCIQVWWDPFREIWRASTLGTITTTDILGYEEHTFERLSWETLPAEMTNRMLQGWTYLFELCCKQNRILTRYEENCVYLLAMRENETGTVRCSPQHINYLAAVTEVKAPRSISLADAGIENLQQTVDWVEQEAKSGEYGEYPEGFVIYDDSGPLCKMKNTAYVAMFHATGIGNPAHSLSCAISAFWMGSYDDIEHVLEDGVKDHIEQIKQWIRDKAVELQGYAVKLQALDLSTDRGGKRAYAAAVEEMTQEPKLVSFLFTHRETDPTDVHAVFVNWLEDDFRRKPVKSLRFWKRL